MSESHATTHARKERGHLPKKNCQPAYFYSRQTTLPELVQAQEDEAIYLALHLSLIMQDGSNPILHLASQAVERTRSAFTTGDVQRVMRC